MGVFKKGREMKLLLTFLVTLLLVLSTGCNSRDDRAKEDGAMAGGMKCGAGKCGANMFDGSAALVKKKENIIKQMREDDSRRDCVIKASSTKALYDCVRDPKTKKMSKKCGSGKCGATTKEPAMKCGGAMQKSKPEPKPTMKCGAGKCGNSM